MRTDTSDRDTFFLLILISAALILVWCLGIYTGKQVGREELAAQIESGGSYAGD